MRPPSSSSSSSSSSSQSSPATRAGAALALALVLLACSDDGGTTRPLDCAWLTSNNCWRSTAALASDCLPPVTAFGTLNAASTVCTYPDGATVTFDQALTLPISPDNLPEWSFTVARAGTTCLRYERTEFRRTLTASGQTYSDMPSGAAGVRVSCPDGTIYATDDESTITSCPGAQTRVPNEAWSSNLTSATMDLIGAGPDGAQLRIFDCRRP